MVINGMSYQYTRNQNSERLRSLMSSGATDFRGTYPMALNLEPSSHCNARCPLCPTGADELGRGQNHMKPALFRGIVDEVAPYVSKMTLYNYGEPFLNPSIFDMIDYADEHDITTKISTNGTAFYRDAWIESLVTSGLDELIVSLDGADAETFNQYRVGLPFDPIIPGLYKLRDLKKRYQSETPHVHVQMLAMRHNQHQVEDIRAIAAQAEAHFVVKSVNLGMVSNGFDLFDEYMPTQPDMPRRYEQSADRGIVPKQQVGHYCPIVWTSMMINADGTVNPCCYDYHSDWVIGRLPEQSVGDIWQGERFAQLRTQIHDDITQIPICRTCSVAALIAEQRARV